MDVYGVEGELVVVLEAMRMQIVVMLFVFYMIMRHRRLRRSRAGRLPRRRYSLLSKVPDQVKHLDDLLNASDEDCFNSLRMDRNAFARLCTLVEQVGGLKHTRAVSIPEQVAMFLMILAHHKKNRIVKQRFKRSARTVSIHFNNVLLSILRLHPLLAARPDPVDNTCTNDRWKHFQGCVGALDGTMIPVRVAQTDKAKYRTRKGLICVNVLAVCDRNMNFIYVLSGWEGSAADGRVLHSAVIRPNGLKVPIGNYYLCDAGYTNCEGFLTPFRGVRYHLSEWGPRTRRPQNPRECFNLNHARARNIIERSFLLLKERWAILRSNSWYPIDTHNRIIMACCLLHNFIRRELAFDPLEALIPEFVDEIVDNDHPGHIHQVESSPQWNAFRDTLANQMFNNLRGGGIVNCGP